MTNHYDELETRSPDQRKSELIKALSDQLQHAKSNAPAYTEILHNIDCTAVTHLKDLQCVPLTRKTELMDRQRQTPPLGGLTAFSTDQMAHIFSSPGPIYEACTFRPDFYRLARALYAAGFRKGDIAHNCFSYHLTPAGQMLNTGCHALGCSVIPAGVGQTDLQVQTIHDLKPNGYVGTPSFLKIILEKADELNMDVRSMKKGLVSGEALPPTLRAGFSERGMSILQCYATADLGLIAYESSADTGLIIDEGVYLEIVRPGTGEVVADGEVGEVVVTTLNPDYPLIRFATGDLSAILDGQSDCGRSNRRIKGWMGRADQTAKVKGMFIHPKQVNEVVKRHSEIDRARLVIDWVDQADVMKLHCESEQQSVELKAAIESSIRDLCKVRGNVVFVAPNSLANDGMVIEDIRKYD